MRERGVPARCRCGFATYFDGGLFEDHWICEYWKGDEGRWVRVDAQIDYVQSAGWRMNRDRVDFLDLSRDLFLPAGVLWKLFRDGFIEGSNVGFYGMEDGFGEWYIRGNMLRDFFALNKVEYTYMEEDCLMERDRKLTRKELAFLDEVADVTARPDVNFERLRRLYERHGELRPR